MDRPTASRPPPPRDRNAVAHGQAPRPAGLPGVALWLQSATGNARVVRAMTLLRQLAPGPAPPPAPAPKVTSLVNRVADFTTTKATLGGVGVHATGRLVVSGQATVIDAKLPANAAAGAVARRATELVAVALAAATPTGSATRIEVSLGGNPLVLELTAAPVGPAFQVTGHFTAKAGTLSVPGVGVASPQITLDATVWIAPPTPATTPGSTSDTSRIDSAGPPARNLRRARRPEPPGRLRELRRPLPSPPRRRRATPR